MKSRLLSPAALGNAVAILVLMTVALLFARLQEGWLSLPAPSAERGLLAGLAVLLWLVLCGALLFMHGRERRQTQARRAALATGARPAWWVFWASQTGFAERLAWQTAEALQAAGQPVHLRPLAELDPALLPADSMALLIVSTTGEGDAPDAASGFARRMANEAPALSGLRYGLLALGDSSYAHFCAFGRRLDSWLQRQGATAVIERVEVDNGDADALRRWRQALAGLTDSQPVADWSVSPFQHWCLAQRRWLNPGSLGGAVFHLELQAPAPVGTAPYEWEAGDIAEVLPAHAPAEVAALLAAAGADPTQPVLDDGSASTLGQAVALRQWPGEAEALTAWRSGGVQSWLDWPTLPPREYSIASVPADGRLELVLRQHRAPNGRLGLGSGWLTEYAPLGADIALRLRPNPGFRSPPDDRPLILIGNGTGIAGLRSHLRARELKGHHRNWLVFGEREAATDFLFQEQLQGWLASGHLSRLDLAFSRDQAQPVYVQDKLRQAASTLREWAAAGAAIYVCGSLNGMAPAVADVLISVLGEARLEHMAETGHYRRDVY